MFCVWKLFLKFIARVVTQQTFSLLYFLFITSSFVFFFAMWLPYKKRSFLQKTLYFTLFWFFWFFFLRKQVLKCSKLLLTVWKKGSLSLKCFLGFKFCHKKTCKNRWTRMKNWKTKKESFYKKRTNTLGLGKCIKNEHWFFQTNNHVLQSNRFQSISLNAIYFKCTLFTENSINVCIYPCKPFSTSTIKTLN